MMPRKHPGGHRQCQQQLGEQRVGIGTGGTRVHVEICRARVGNGSVGLGQ